MAELDEGIWCEDCEHVHPASKEKPEESWCCMKAPIRAGVRGVTRERRKSYDPPYALCRYINSNLDCEMFEPIRKPKEEAA
jgi:hypothetical protein